MTEPGTIMLVGAGPGDPELLTLAGLKALREAEVVIFDRLVNPELLAHAPPEAERIDAGKTPGLTHAMAQERINRIMIERARAGRRVVRLKGGDPLIFGRGGEELQAARAAGIPVRVIPGVTAAQGAAAALQIPLTHRAAAASVAFVTGCGAGGEEPAGVNWQALATRVDTLVVYMGARRLAAIAQELIAGGRPVDDPVALVRQATLPDQEVRILTLYELAHDPAAADIAPPVIMITGAALHLREGQQTQADPPRKGL
jgi:uroporphyrin-III C-methyltransferase